MGLDQGLVFPDAGGPAYGRVAELLKAHGLAARLVMIDGQLAFPDETPPDNWRELRVALGSGMVTVRRAANRLSLIVWGNADLELLRFRNALAWACAVAGAGQVETPEGLVAPDAFRRAADLPAGFP